MPIEVKHGTGIAAGIAQLAGQEAANQRQEVRDQRKEEIELRGAVEKDMMVFRYGLEMQARQRAEEWELEKMQLASQNDFLRMEKIRDLEAMSSFEEHKRQEAELKAKLRAIDEYEYFTDEEKQAAKLKLQTGIKSYNGPDSYSPNEMIAQRKLQRMMELEQKINTGQATTADVAMFNRMTTGSGSTEEDQVREMERDYERAQEILSLYQEGADVAPWRLWGEVDLAVVDKNGKPIREATPEEKQEYEYYKKRAASIRNQLTSGSAQVPQPEEQNIEEQDTRVRMVAPNGRTARVPRDKVQQMIVDYDWKVVK